MTSTQFTLLTASGYLDGWFCVLPMLGHVCTSTSKGDTQDGCCWHRYVQPQLDGVLPNASPKRWFPSPGPGLLKGPLPLNFLFFSEDSRKGQSWDLKPCLPIWEETQAKHLASCPDFRKVMVGAPLLHLFNTSSLRQAQCARP